jgi:hypothetical protein
MGQTAAKRDGEEGREGAYPFVLPHAAELSAQEVLHRAGQGEGGTVLGGFLLSSSPLLPLRLQPEGIIFLRRLVF